MSYLSFINFVMAFRGFLYALPLHSVPFQLCSVSLALFCNMLAKEPCLANVIRTQTHPPLVPDSTIVPISTSVCMQPRLLPPGAPRSQSVRPGPVAFGNCPAYSVTHRICNSAAHVSPRFLLSYTALSDLSTSPVPLACLIPVCCLFPSPFILASQTLSIRPLFHSV